MACNIKLILDFGLVLCCDIYHNTLTSIMYPACMITVHGHNRGRYKLVSEPTVCRKPLTTTWSMFSLEFAKNYFANLMFGLWAHIIVTPCDIHGIRILFLLTYALRFCCLILASKVY